VKTVQQRLVDGIQQMIEGTKELIRCAEEKQRLWAERPDHDPGLIDPNAKRKIMKLLDWDLVRLHDSLARQEGLLAELNDEVAASR
jgi:hypothetical protein